MVVIELVNQILAAQGMNQVNASITFSAYFSEIQHKVRPEKRYI